MKYIICLLLLGSICNAQQYKNYTKVTAYRLANTDELGPCNILDYAKRLKRTGHYIQAMESYNDTLAYNLLKLKQEAQTWKKDTCTCGQKSVGRALVPNMFIVEVNTHKDTIFTTSDHKAVYSVNEKAQYTAPENYITSLLPKDVNQFFKRDFVSEISAWKMDSVSSKDITLHKKAFYGLTRKQFEKNVSYFHVATTDTMYMDIGKPLKVSKLYSIDNIQFSFYEDNGKLSKVTTNTYSNNYSPMNVLNVDGVKIGDSEEVLCSKYDNSTSLKYWDAPLSTITNYYTYEVNLTNGEGLIRYVVRNTIIREIEIQFSYPAKPEKKVAVIKKKK
jgi:hypothetical protein